MPPRVTRAAKAAEAPAPTTPSVRTQPIGVSGLIYSGGEIREERLDDLRGPKGVKTFGQMGDDAIIGAGLRAIRLLILQAEWRVEPANREDADAVAAKRFLDECIADLGTTGDPWRRTLGEILTMNQFGWAAMEPVYKYRRGPEASRREDRSQYADGLTGWQGLEPRSQDSLVRWEFDDRGRVEEMIQQDPNQYREIPIPIDDLLLFAPERTKGNPEGRALIRAAYESWYYKVGARRFEAIVLERFGGFPKVTMPAEYMLASASVDQASVRDALVCAATQFRVNRQSHFTIPALFDERGNKLFDIAIEPSKADLADFDRVINRYNREIAISMLVDILLLGHEKVGSYALSSSKTDLLGYALAAIMDEVCDVMNRKAIPELFRRNPQFPAHALPKLVHGDVETPDLSVLGSYIQALQMVGVDLSDEPTQQLLRRVADLPQTVQQTA